MGPFLACGVPLVNFLPNRFPIDRSQQGRCSRVQPSKQQGIHTFALSLSLLDPTDQDPHVLYAFRQFHAPLEIYGGLQTVLIVSVSSRTAHRLLTASSCNAS